MNLFSDYQKKIFNYLQILKKNKIITIPDKIRNVVVEMPPKNQKADMSCNAAMLLAKPNARSPHDLAKLLKKHLLNNFKEFKDIEVAGPGFLNIYLHNSCWKVFLLDVINSGSKYGSTKGNKKYITYLQLV